MRELGQQPERRGTAPVRCPGPSQSSSKLFVGEGAEQGFDVGDDASRGALIGRRRDSSAIVGEVAAPSQRFRISTAMASGLNTRSGASKHHAALCLVVDEAHAARQARLARI